jgi:V8-like Glu-specific endopeptidase
MSSKYDLALLRTDSIQSKVATITSVVPQVGNSIDVVGFPSSLRPRRVSVRANGRYRGARAGGSGVKILSVGVRVSGGSSGSPVLDDKGRVIGVVFAKMDTRQHRARNDVVPSRRSEDIALATSARNLTTFLRGNGVKVSANTTAQNRAEDYAVRVNCLE